MSCIKMVVMVVMMVEAASAIGIQNLHQSAPLPPIAVAPFRPGPRGQKPQVAFSVRKASGSTSAYTQINFKDVLTNIGGGFQHSGQFVAPYHGIYFFTFHAASSKDSDFTLALSKNGEYQVTAYGTKGAYNWGSNSVVLELYPGDRITLDLQQGTIYDHPGNEAYTTFSGFLISAY